MEIREDDLSGAEIAALPEAHLSFARQHSPPESVHALDLDALRVPEITFWTVWEGRELLGCGALRELDPTHGEIKSMHTAKRHRCRGIAARLLAHIIAEARRRGYGRLSLETGGHDPFLPPRSLHARFGLVPAVPFAEHRVDPRSACMTLDLSAAFPGE